MKSGNGTRWGLEKLKKRGLGMFKKVASIVAMLLVFLCGAQSMSVSAGSVEEVILTEKYSIIEEGKLIKNTKFVVESNIDVLISVEAKNVVFENVEICGNGKSGRIIQATNNGSLTLNGVVIRSSIKAVGSSSSSGSVSRVVYARGPMIIEDLAIEDGVSDDVDFDIENFNNPITIEKTNIRSICLRNGSIVVNQNTDLKNVIEISFKLDSELKEVGKTIVQGDKDFPASNVRNKFRLDESLKGEFSLGTSGNDLILVAYDPNLDVVEGEDNETPEGGDEDGSESVDPSAGESQSGGSDNGGGQGGEDVDKKEENQGGETPSEGDEKVEPTVVEAVLDVNDFVYDGTDQFGSVKASYMLDNASYPLGVRLFEDAEMVNAKEYTLEFFVLDDDPNLGKIELRNSVGKITIKKRGISVKLEKEKFEYSGSPIELNPIVENEASLGEASVELMGERETNAGTYEVEVSVGNPNYELQGSVTLKYAIDKKRMTIDNIQTKDILKTYDGSAYITTSYATAGGLVEVTYLDLEKCVNVGTYHINLSYSLTEKASKNYVLPEDLNPTATLTISPRPITPTLQQNAFVYNGQTPEFKVNLENVVGDDNPELQLVYSRDKVDVDEYTLTIRLEDGERNYKFETETVTLPYSITKAAIDTSEIEIKNLSKTFDGKPIECEAYVTANGLVNVSYGDIAYKNAGTYTLNLVCTLTEIASKNHTLPTNLKPTATLTIFPRLITPTLVESVFAYSGKTSNFNIVLSGLVNGDNPKVNIMSGEKHIDVGEYELKVCLDKNEKNYKFETETITLPYSITKAEINASEIEIKNLSKTFDGSPIECEAYITANGLVNVSYEENVYVEAGTYTLNLVCTLTENATKNYSLPEDLNLTATLNISPRLITPSLKEKSFVYSGVTPTLELDFEGAINGFVPKVKVDKSTDKSVGKHNVFVSLTDEEKNYTFSSKVITLTYSITPRILTATLRQNEYTYTGYAPSVEVALSGICNKDIVSCGVDIDKIYTVGTYSCRLTLCGEDAKEYVLDEFCLTLNYSITKAEIDMSKVVFENDEIEYTGAKYVPQISGVPSGVKVSFRANTESYSVGDYVVVATFELLDPLNFSLSLDTLKMNLHITPKVVDLSGVVLEDMLVIYTGDEYTLEPQNVPEVGVKVDALTSTIFVDAGDYEISYSFSSVNQNYTLNGDAELTATLHIQKADIDMSGVTLEGDKCVYDGNPHTVTLTGTLPGVVTALALETHTHSGEYTITQEFEVTNPNYNVPSPFTAKLNILKRPLTATLSKVEFTYTGNEFETKLVLHGVLDGDTVTASISGNKNTLAGAYKATLVGLDNDDYILFQTEYPYEIHKAKIDMSGVVLQDKEITYDASVYTPTLEGTLPNVVSYNLTYPKIKNAGEYTILASFSTDANHICPSPMTAKITVSPKPIVAHFSNFSNLVYTGEVQEITCVLSGMLEPENYSLIYSNEPKEVGEYTAQVLLQNNSNYVIWNSSICTFNIHTNTKTTTSDEYTLTLEGGLFTAGETPSLKTVKLSKNIQNSLTTMHKDIANLESFEIRVDGDYAELETHLKLSSLKSSSPKSITLYTISSDGTLEKLDCTLSGDTLTFKATPNTVLILVEESTPNIIPIILTPIAILLALTLSIALPLAIRHKKRKKRESLTARDFICDKN